MTDRARRRTSFTQAELARAIRAADTVGKVALQTRAGIAFVDPATIPHTRSEDSKVDEWLRTHDID